MRPRVVTRVLVVVTLVSTASLYAQPVQIQLAPATPRMEFGAHLNFLDLLGDASRTWGGRFAKRHADWLMSEFSYDKTSWQYEARESRLLIADVRFQNPTPRMGKRGFVAVGVAKADGLSFDWSPVLSSGVQHESPGGIAAFRFEVQLFLRGHSAPGLFDRGRILLGIGVGIP